MQLREQLKRQGIMIEVFSFVDAKHLINKVQLWKERDTAIKEKYERLNNEAFQKLRMISKSKFAVKEKTNIGMATNSMSVQICKADLSIRWQSHQPI